MPRTIARREFLARAARGGAAAALGLALPHRTAPAASPPAPGDHTLAVIAGTPRERGRLYGSLFRDPIRAFLKSEILDAFDKNGAREAMLRYAGACFSEVKGFSPIIADELEGIAEGTGLRVEDLTLITLHEELWHRGVIPSISHCTAIAAGPPHTRDGRTYVGQTWDWMAGVYGLSSIVHWRRTEGPSLLGYAYPGLWAGAGLNAAGIALTWTSGSGLGIAGPRVGIPSYVLITQMLYQNTLRAALDEARRAKNAGWFTFVLADGDGNLANVEGTPAALAVEMGRGCLARVDYGSREITGTKPDSRVKVHPRCRHMAGLLETARGEVDGARLQRFLADHGAPEDAATAVCVHGSTLDAVLFDTTRRELHVTRGPACASRWRTFTFGGRRARV
jgi:isopenicillin-N N-acyltransferase-like protein